MPILVLSDIITLLPIIEFLITTLFLIKQFLPISTPLEMKQFFPISDELSIFAYFSHGCDFYQGYQSKGLYAKTFSY